MTQTLPADPTTATVADLARELPATIAVFQRHHIDFCCQGKRSLGEACAVRGLDPQAIVAELSAALVDDVDPGQLPATLADLCKLIVGRYHVALRGELPRLLAMADRVERVHGADLPEVIPPLVDTLRAFAAELDEHMRAEEEIVFPAIERLERTRAAGSAVRPDDLAATVAIREDEHRAAGAALERMRELTFGYTPPDWACNTFRGLFHGLERLEREMHVHVHLENNVLFPAALRVATPAA